MGTRYISYLLADSREGQLKEAELSRSSPSSSPVNKDIRRGFVYERVPHITLKAISNNPEIDIISDRYRLGLEGLCKSLNTAIEKNWEEWEIPRRVAEDARSATA
jgi:adenine-specific DNA-methyltransferase